MVQGRFAVYNFIMLCFVIMFVLCTFLYFRCFIQQVYVHSDGEKRYPSHRYYMLLLGLVSIHFLMLGRE